MISLQNIQKSFGPDAVALRKIDIEIEQGEAVAILGKSGSGKTTLMDILGTLSRPTGGTYLLNGECVNRLGDRRLSSLRRTTFGYIFQAFNLVNDWTVKKNLILAMRYSRKPGDAELQKALDSINLGDKLNARVNTLSGGEQQRVAILRTTMRNPEIILADEPTGNLDPVNADLVMSLLFKLREGGRTLIMITHSNELASRFPRLVRLEKGVVVSGGTK